MSLPQISPELVDKHTSEVKSISSLATAKRKETSLRKFFDWAHQEGRIDQNPLPPILANSSHVVSSPDTKYRILNTANLLRGGLLVALVILALILSRRLRLPIPFLPAPAEEPSETEIALVTPAPSPRPEDDRSLAESTKTIIAQVKEELQKEVAGILEWASYDAGNLLIGGAPVSSIVLSTGDTTAVGGNQLTITSSPFQAKQNSAFGAGNIVKGQTAAKIGSFVLSASSAEGINVSTITLTSSFNFPVCQPYD